MNAKIYCFLPGYLAVPDLNPVQEEGANGDVKVLFDFNIIVIELKRKS
jgi:hypothetical protein